MSAKKKPKRRAPKPPPTPPSRDASGYEAEKNRSAERSAIRSAAGRDIADEFPAVVDPARKQKGAESLEFFCRVYLPQTFSMAWSNDHRKAIALLQQVTREGGLDAFAMPRGSGKTSLTEADVLWAILYGYRLFPVIVGSDEGSSLEILSSVKTELECNDLLLEDFPEVCYPIRCLEGISHRAHGQTFNGKRTHIQWTAQEIVLPMIPGSKAAGVAVRVAGLTGRIRGMKFKTADGRSLRPDLALIDDPQTDESAKSPSQCATREKIICGTILGLAGPGKKIAAMMPCTVIEQDDLSDRILNRKKHPEWQGERSKMLVSLPANTEIWDKYAALRADSLRAGNGGKEATEFYRANREAMDLGAEASWPVRFNPDEVSAIQHAMNLKIDNPVAFAAEYQNEPLREELRSDLLTVDEITAKINARARATVPSECTKLVGFIDVQQNVLFWTVAGFEDDFTGYVIDYGTFPEQNRSHFRLTDCRRTLKSVLGVKSVEESLRMGLERLTAELLEKQWRRDDGSGMKIERCPIDANWGDSRDLVYKFAHESTHSAIVIPSHGMFVGAASSRPFSEYKLKRGERKGLHWRSTLTADRPIQRRFIIDANFWKSFVHERLRVGSGGRGCLSLFGSAPEDHRLFAEHLTSEDPIRVEARGQTVIEWKDRPAKPDNHWFDCLVGCHAAAAERGASLQQLTAPTAPRGKRVRLSEIQKEKAKNHG